MPEFMRNTLLDKFYGREPESDPFGSMFGFDYSDEEEEEEMADEMFDDVGQLVICSFILWRKIYT